MVEVFRTNITHEDAAEQVAAGLRALYPMAIISFDLEDCDNILRIAGEGFHAAGIAAHVHGIGYLCEALD